MVKFTATIHQFGEQGEKTGWTYIEVPVDIAEKLNFKIKKSFRVKGKLDKYTISGIALIPMGGGRFIMPLNAIIRKGIHKKKGGSLEVQISVDTKPLLAPDGFYECLQDEPIALTFFNQLKESHRNYFIKWMGGVKSEEAVANRMAKVINALIKEQDFVTMFRSLKVEKDLRK